MQLVSNNCAALIDYVNLWMCVTNNPSIKYILALISMLAHAVIPMHEAVSLNATIGSSTTLFCLGNQLV